MALVGSAYCPYCKRQVLARKKCNHLLHGIVSILTCGFWLLVWAAIIILSSDWYCTRCGGSVKEGTRDPAAN